MLDFFNLVVLLNPILFLQVTTSISSNQQPDRNKMPPFIFYFSVTRCALDVPHHMKENICRYFCLFVTLMHVHALNFWNDLSVHMIPLKSNVVIIHQIVIPCSTLKALFYGQCHQFLILWPFLSTHIFVFLNILSRSAKCHVMEVK